MHDTSNYLHQIAELKTTCLLLYLHTKYKRKKEDIMYSVASAAALDVAGCKLGCASFDVRVSCQRSFARIFNLIRGD